jgi:hypothetical protein
VKLAGGLTLLLLAGCSHGDPFASRRWTTSGPFQNGAPLRLTFSFGHDTWPSWTPDGSAIYYTAELTESVEADRCVARLSSHGGTRADIQCPLGFDQLTDEYEQPTSDGTRLAWVQAEVGVNQSLPYHFSIWTAPVAPRSSRTEVQTFPYITPSGRPHDTALFLQWLRPGVLLYLGAQSEGCCRTDTLRFGDQVALLDLTGDGAPDPTLVPGTDRASAVSGSEDGGSIFYTFYDDSRVYRQELASGTVTLIHDFGAGHLARDPVVQGNRLYAVVDGKANPQAIPPFGQVQVDYGGVLVLVDLATGIETRLADVERLYRRPRLAPGGGRLVAEGYPFTVTTIVVGGVPVADTTVTRISDLWILEE